MTSPIAWDASARSPATRKLKMIVRAAFVLAVAIPIAFLSANTFVAAQGSTSGIAISSVVITQTRVNAETVSYQASVTVSNTSTTDFSGIERLDYRIDGGEKQLAYIVTNLAAGDSSTVTFTFALTPGDHTVIVLIGDSQSTNDISVDGADVAVEVSAHRFTRGSTVEFDLQISNHGSLSAADVTLNGTWHSTSDESLPEGTTIRELGQLETDEQNQLSIPIAVTAGSYTFDFVVSTSTIEGEASNNSASISLDVEFVDLRVSVASTESLGWDGSGRALISLLINVENAGIDDSERFNIGFKCIDDTIADCSKSILFGPIPADSSIVNEVTVWLPIGETPAKIFAAENEDTFLWGELNAIDHTVDVPTAPHLVWNLSRTSTPMVESYWSDGSANVDVDLTFVNNGTDETQTVTIECLQDDVVVSDCGNEFTVQKEPDIYPTMVTQTVRLPAGDTDLLFSYGAESTKSVAASVPERIIGVERDVWECFGDTSFMGTDDEEDLGIGCAGWNQEIVTKWPVGEVMAVWTNGDARYIEIFKETFADLAPLLNLQVEYVPAKTHADLVVYTGWPREDAEATGLECTDNEFGGCARRWVDDDSTIKEARIAIWTNASNDEKRRENYIRSASLHELIHAIADVKHRHHDRTSVMSYEALDYATLDGIDVGLLSLHAHPLVKPGMTFDDVLELIAFADELNDPPEPAEPTAQTLLRRAHAFWMDADTVSYEIRGDWPRCAGNHRFGWGRYEFGNLQPRIPFWQHFHDGNDRYYFIANPSDWNTSEYWLKRGRQWQKVDGTKVFENTTFRSGFTNPFQMLSDINIYARATDYEVVSRSPNRVVIEVSIDGPNPPWSRNLDLEIRIELHPETYSVSKFKMTWNFNPRSRDSCDIYSVEARNPVYGDDFTFPDQILEGSKILNPPPSTIDATVDTSAIN